MWSANTLFTLAVVLPPVALFAPRGTVVIGALAAIAALRDRETRVHARDLLISPFGIVLAIALVWPLATTFWSPDTDRALGVWGSLAAITVAGTILLAAGRTAANNAPGRVAQGLLVAGVLFGVLATIELASGRWLTGLVRGSTLVEVMSRGSAILAIMVFPIAVAAWRRGGVPAAGAFLFALIGIVVALPMMAAVVAVMAAVLVGAALWGWPRVGWGALHLGILAAVLLVPPGLLLIDTSGLSYAATGIPENWLHRVHMWRFAMERFAEAPIFGWGLDGARALPGGTAQIPQLNGHAPYLPLHPHNAAIQLWVELGVVGAVLAGTIVSFFLTRIRLLHTERQARAAMAASVTAWFVIAELSFGFWQNWWLAVPWIAAAFWRAIAEPTRPQRAT
ncbi:MAG: O-antigen ligase family protein [Alphaproteobacteria bacterium]|nr:O-antigen ligase family protein [Alphaproteobacteria bacterium]